MGHEREIFEALEAAGARQLEPRQAQWIAERMRFGYSPEAQNIGGLRCTAPHVHTGEGCVSVPGVPYRLAKFASWADAARALVATSRRATAPSDAPAPDLPQVGFRSTHPDPTTGETGDLTDWAKRAAEIVDPLGSRLLWGPSAEAEATFRGLLADWESFERAGVPDKHPELRDTFIAWVKFRDAWLSGNTDEAALNPAVTDANRVRRTLAEKAGQPQPEDRPNVQFDDLNSRNSAFSWLSKKADAVVPNAIPQPLKGPVGIGVVAVGLIALLYLTAPLVSLLGGGGGRTVVVVPPQETRPRGKR